MGLAEICKTSPMTGEFQELRACPSVISHEGRIATSHMRDVKHQALGSVIASRRLVYVVGGLMSGTGIVETDDDEDECAFVQQFACNPDVWCFDTCSTEWRPGPPLHVPRHGAKLVTLNGNIFVLGGSSEPN